MLVSRLIRSGVVFRNNKNALFPSSRRHFNDSLKNKSKILEKVIPLNIAEQILRKKAQDEPLKDEDLEPEKIDERLKKAKLNVSIAPRKFELSAEEREALLEDFISVGEKKKNAKEVFDFINKKGNEIEEAYLRKQDKHFVALERVFVEKLQEFEKENPQSNLLIADPNNQELRDFEYYCETVLEPTDSECPKDLAPEEEANAEKIFKDIEECPFKLIGSAEDVLKDLDAISQQAVAPLSFLKGLDSKEIDEKLFEGFPEYKNVEDDRFWFRFANVSMIVILLFMLNLTFHEELGERKEIASMGIRTKDYPWGDSNLLPSPHADHHHH